MNRVAARLGGVAALLLASPACSFLGGTDDDGDGDTTGGSDTGTGDTGTDDTGGPPDEGFRVFPKYLLQDIPAIVTIEVELMPVACPPDDVDGGYLCDASGVSDTTAIIRVERDGFDSASRNPTIAPGELQPLDVHLSGEGGATGTWSGCVAAGMAATCDAVCEGEAGVCSPASCDTEDPQWPLATHQTFSNADCVDAPDESLALGCSETLPEGGGDVVSLRCCCAP